MTHADIMTALHGLSEPLGKVVSDFSLDNDGYRWLLRPNTTRARVWCGRNLGPDAEVWCCSYVLSRWAAQAAIEGLEEQGLSVSGCSL